MVGGGMLALCLMFVLHGKYPGLLIWIDRAAVLATLGSLPAMVFLRGGPHLQDAARCLAFSLGYSVAALALSYAQ